MINDLVGLPLIILATLIFKIFIYMRIFFSFQTDQKINTSEAETVQTVRATFERLGDYEGPSLIDWTTTHIGDPVSYSDIRLANRITLYIDGAGQYINMLFTQLTV